MATPPFRTNPSAIARYFFHDCERFLYYTAVDPAMRKGHGIPKPEFDRSPLVEAILASGYRWEEEVVTRLLKGRVVVASGSGELHTRRLSPTQTLRCLGREPAGRFLYQPTLVPPPLFYDASASIRTSSSSATTMPTWSRSSLTETRAGCCG